MRLLVIGSGMIGGAIARVCVSAGHAAVDAGRLEQSARQQPGTPVYNVPGQPSEITDLLARGSGG